VHAPPSQTQLYAYMLLSVAPPYLHSKLRDHMLSQGWADYLLPDSWLSILLPWKKGARRPGARTRYLKRLVWEVTAKWDQLSSAAKLINFLVFLYNGRCAPIPSPAHAELLQFPKLIFIRGLARYRSLLDRILGLRLVYAQPSVDRNVSFEFLNRQLVWEALTVRPALPHHVAFILR
jgi:peroxin-2